MGQLYGLALEAYMDIDEGLNGGMTYIAIDMSNFEGIDETNKEQILSYFESYPVAVMEATHAQLMERGLHNPETLVLHGVLLLVETTEVSGRKIVVEGSKFRAGDGGIGTRVVVEYKRGTWQVTKAEGTWIS